MLHLHLPRVKGLLIVFVAILFLGCKSAPQPVVRLATALDPSGAPVAEQYQIPVQHGEIEVPAGWEDSRLTAEITVPPSTEPTTIYVRPKKRKVMDKILPPREQNTVDVVSTNPGTAVKQESVTPWWWWAAGAIGLLGGLYLVISRVWGVSRFCEAIRFIIGKVLKRGMK